MTSTTTAFLPTDSPLLAEQRATLALGEMLAAVTMGYAYRDARVDARSITEMPSQFGASEQFRRVSDLAEQHGISWTLWRDGTFKVTTRLAPTPPEQADPDHSSPVPRAWFLTADELAATRAKVAKLNARAVRKGFTGRVELTATPAIRNHTPAPGAPPVTLHGFEVTLDGQPPSYAGWQFVAAIDKLSEPTPSPTNHAGTPPPVAIRYPPGADQTFDHSAVRPGECDHCHTVRPRSTTFLVRHVDTGELKQVGRTCLKDFLGTSVTPVFLDADKISDDIDRSQGTGPRQWAIESILTYAWAVVAAHGWTPASATGTRPATRDLVTDALLGGPHARDLLASIADHLDQGQHMATRILAELPAHLTSGSGYEANLADVLRAGSVGPKHLGLAVSAVNAWNRMVEHQVADEVRSQRRDNVSHAGTVGQPITLTGTVLTATRVPGYHYRSPDQALLVIDCGTAVAKTITSATWAYPIERGDQVTITGIVKAHQEYRGVPQTVLTRPKRIDNPTPSEVAPTMNPDAAWEVVNATQAGPRPFPGPSHPLAETAQHRPVRP
ncbi:MAG: hypothetical protein LCH76_15145 [Actinobacteria bacterium]|nr:hypothetical protein [Actinomycetota bacterium]